MRWKIAVKLVIVAVLAMATTITVLKGKSQNTSQPSKGKKPSASQTQLPVTDFYAAVSLDQQRQERNKRHNSTDKKARVFNDTMPEEVFELPLSHQPPEAALPVRESDAVVIGSATEARAYVSSDKTNVYSE